VLKFLSNQHNNW